MSDNGDILSSLIAEDFGFTTRENSRWGKSEKHDSLVLDKDRGIFYWNSENIVGDPLVYLTKVRKLSFRDAKEYLKNFRYNGTFVYTIREKEEDVVVYPKLVEVFFELGMDKEKRKYMYDRGITDETLDRFNVGWYNDWTMVPFFEDYTFRNFQMRRDIPKKEFRSYYKAGPLMFNSDILKLVKRVYYTEGPVDALALLQNGLPAISSNSGGGFLPAWYPRFFNIREIVILFDNDKAGVNEAKRLAKFLGTERCLIYCFSDYEDIPRYDPVDFFLDGNTKEDLEYLVKSNGKMEFEL